jgi:hypothetical protein
VADAREALKGAHEALDKSEGPSTEEAGDTLTSIGLDLARLGAAGMPSREPSKWQPLRALGWDLIRIGGRLQVPRLADTEKTRDMIEASTKAVESLGQS